MGLLSVILDLLFPPKCVLCRKLLEKDEKDICVSCRKESLIASVSERRSRGDFFTVCVSPWYYKDDVREAILRYKFRDRPQYADCFGKILADCIRQDLAGKYDLITWVPLNAIRRAERGYDQSRLLAMAAANELGEEAVGTLVKPQNIKAQSEIKEKSKRKANINGAYKVLDAQAVCGKRILIIDDIVTTGSTISECARMLLAAGAKSVVAATLAKTEK